MDQINDKESSHRLPSHSGLLILLSENISTPPHRLDDEIQLIPENLHFFECKIMGGVGGVGAPRHF